MSQPINRLFIIFLFKKVKWNYLPSSKIKNNYHYIKIYQEQVFKWPHKNHTWFNSMVYM